MSLGTSQNRAREVIDLDGSPPHPFLIWDQDWRAFEHGARQSLKLMPNQR